MDNLVQRLPRIPIKAVAETDCRHLSISNEDYLRELGAIATALPNHKLIKICK